MVVILLSALVCKSNNDTKIPSEKSDYLNEKQLFIGRLRVKSVPGMRYKHQPCLYTNQHNQLKSYLAKKNSKLITKCISKRDGGKKQE